MKAKAQVLNGMSDAGNPHVRFDEGEVASAKPRRPLYGKCDRAAAFVSNAFARGEGALREGVRMVVGRELSFVVVCVMSIVTYGGINDHFEMVLKAQQERCQTIKLRQSVNAISSSEEVETLTRRFAERHMPKGLEEISGSFSIPMDAVGAKVGRVDYRDARTGASHVFSSWIAPKIQRPLCWLAEGYLAVDCAGTAELTNFLAHTVFRSPSTGAFAVKSTARLMAESVVAVGLFSGKRYVSPFRGGCYVVFVDDSPQANWGHPCRLVFVKDDLTAFAVWYLNAPVKVEADATEVKLEPLDGQSKRSAPSIAETRAAINALLPNAAAENGAIVGVDADHTYAVLISGGYNIMNNHTRYWGDVAAVYSTLTKRYGIPKSHIRVCMSDGGSPAADVSSDYDSSSHSFFPNKSSPSDLDGDDEGDVMYPALEDSIVEALSLKNELTQDDQLFVFVTDHGDQDEDTGECSLCLWNDTMMSADRFAELMRGFSCPVFFALEFCYSGAFIEKLQYQQGDRAIATAAGVEPSSAWALDSRETGVSWTRAYYYMDPWVYYFVGAMRGCFPKVLQWPWENSEYLCYADTSDDGWVSLKEAADYAKRKIIDDGYPECPGYGEFPSGFGASHYLVKRMPLPANDDFATAAILDGIAGSATGSNVLATSQEGEPLLESCPTAKATVWWKWTALSDGNLELDTAGSSFEPKLGIYTGATLSSLEPIAKGNGKCVFECTAGTTYFICVGGGREEVGQIVLNWRKSVPPPIASATQGTFIKKIVVSWEAVPRATHYMVFRSYFANGPWREVGGWQTELSFCDRFEDGTYGQDFYYSVVAATSDQGDELSLRAQPAHGWCKTLTENRDEWDGGDDSPSRTPPKLTVTGDVQSHGPHIISTPDDDYFELELKYPYTYVFETTGEADTLGFICDKEGRVYALADEGGSERNFRLVYSPAERMMSAKLYLCVRSRTSDKVDYDLLYSRREPDDYDPGDDVSVTYFDDRRKMNTIRFAESETNAILTQTHGLNEYDLTDHFILNTTSRKWVVIESVGSTNLHADLLFTKSLNTAPTDCIASDDGSGEDGHFRFFFQTQLGEYYLRVTTRTPGERAKYAIRSWIVPETLVKFESMPEIRYVLAGLPYGALPAGERTGYVLKYWHYEGDDTPVTEESIVPDGFSEIRLVGEWRPAVCRVRFDANGGTGEMPDQEIAYGERKKLTKNAFVREGFHFGGWARSRIPQIGTLGPRDFEDGAYVQNKYVEDTSILLRACWWETPPPVWNLYPDEFKAGGTPGGTYTGWLCQDGKVAGTVKVTVSKTGMVSAEVTQATGKKVKYSQEFVSDRKDLDAGDEYVLADKPQDVWHDQMIVQLGDHALGGYYGEMRIVGAVARTDNSYVGTRYLSLADETGALVWMQVQVKAKGAVAVTATMADGTKLTATSQLTFDSSNTAYAPVVLLQKGTVRLAALIRIDGTEIGESNCAWAEEGSVHLALASSGSNDRAQLLGFEPSTNNMVGVGFLAKVTATGAGYPAKFSAKGLPSGLKIDAQTGVISGVPTKSGAFNVTVTLTGTGAYSWFKVSNAFPVEIMPLKAWAQGTFAGYVSPETEGSASLTVAATGKISGKLSVGGTNMTFAASGYSTESKTAEGVFVVQAQAKAGKSLVDVAIRVTETSGPSEELANAKAEGEAGGLALAVWRNFWTDKSAAAVVKSLLAHEQGAYTAQLAAEGCGFGYLTLAVDAKGTVKAAGKLADGTSAGSTSPLLYDERYGVFCLFYVAPSAYKGGCLFLPVGVDRNKQFGVEMNDLLPAPCWRSRDPQATETYGAGFVRSFTEIAGGWYDKLENLRSHYEKLEFLTAVPELSYAYKLTSLDANGKKTTEQTTKWATPVETWNQEGREVAVDVKGKFVIAKKSSPVKDKATGLYSYDGLNDGALTLSFTQSTGVFKGSYTFWYDYESAFDAVKESSTLTHASKKVSFEGVDVPGRGLRGFFLVEQPASGIDATTGKVKTYKYKRSFPVSLTEK